MPLALFIAGAAQGDALVEQHVVADFRGGANDHAHAVIDEESAPDGGAGVDFDACQKAGNLRQKARQNRDAGLIEAVRKPVKKYSVEAGITEENLKDAG